MNEWAAHHTLDRVEITLHLPTPRSDHRADIAARGWSTTKRGSLWTWQESWNPSEMHVEGYEPVDVVHHLLLVAVQDRPNTQERLSFGLGGGLSWSEPELPFSS